MKKFKKIYIEITNICNLSCNFCPKTLRKPKSMTALEFAKIAEKIKPYGDYLYLHIKGEPLLHNDLANILKICENLNFKVCITTNGTLINDKFETILQSKSIHKMHISLHSFEASEINLALDEYLNGIVNLIKSAKFLIVLRLWNDGGMDKLNGEILQKLSQNFDFLRPDKINETTYIENGEKFEWADLDSKNTQNSGFCYGLRDQVGILVDGTVVPCCLDNNGDIALGNIFNEEMNDILNSKRACALFDGFSNRKFSEDLCKSCGFIKRFQK